MRWRDELNAALASHFAWCFAAPGRAPDMAAVERRLAAEARRSAPASGAPAAGDLSRARARARAACRALAKAVEAAWADADPEAAARATKRLLARADRLGIAVVAMDAHPREAVRLLRLFVRHATNWTRRQRERAATVASFACPHHPEVADLLLDMVMTGARFMADALLTDAEWQSSFARRDGLLARLAELVDAAPTPAGRAVAIDLLGRFGAAASAIAPLRRAVRHPDLAVRARAVCALANATPCALTPEDLLFVLRDLLAHPPPADLTDDAAEDDELMLSEAVLRALAHVRPPGAEEALLDLIDAGHDAVWLDAGWATEALAVAFPESAKAMVDHWLKCARAIERTYALNALARFPDAVARSRLRLAVWDPAFRVRSTAREQWRQRFGPECPFDASLIPAGEWLDGPPSELFHVRLLVMHSRLRDARWAMARAILAEPPSREGLVLLVQLLGDDGDSGEPSFGTSGQGLAAAVLAHFGASAIDALASLAARFCEPESFGWMRRLGDLIEQGAVASSDAAPFRRLAARHVASDDTGRVDDALRVLAKLGPPPELFERILALALDDDFGAVEARAIVKAWPDRSIDTRLASEMALALADRQWRRLLHASAMGLARRSPAAQVIAQRVIELAEGEVDVADAAVECVVQLRRVGILDDAWALEALALPDALLFTVAARAWSGSPSVRVALEAALESTARGGASAVQAAIALLQADPPMSPRDRRMSRILSGAPPAERAELVQALCLRGAPLAVFGRHLPELLASKDPSVTGPLVGIGFWLKSPKARALLRESLPRVVDVDLRADLEEILALPPSPPRAES